MREATGEHAQMLFAEIDAHLMTDDRPSVYLRGLLDGGQLDRPPFNVFRRMAETEQNPKYHPEGDVFTHTMLVVDNAAKRRRESSNPRAFMWAALFHDVGKPDTTRLRKGRITAYNHDLVGEKLVRDLLEQLTGDSALIDQISALTRWHMQPFFASAQSGRKQLTALAAQTDYREVALLSWCDRMGRYGVDEQTERAGIDEFVEQMEVLGETPKSP